MIGKDFLRFGVFMVGRRGSHDLAERLGELSEVVFPFNEHSLGRQAFIKVARSDGPF
jgi:hypothetical protein